MQRKTPLIGNENYHIYNRGAHKQNIFLNEKDYKRFELLLYLANNSTPLHLSNLLSNKKYQGESLINIFGNEVVDKSLVDMFAYSLLPNHFHLVLRAKSDGALSLFMKKLLTGYAMYFNTKYEHSGVLFQGPFKSKHIDTEEYFRYIFAYVHLNPFDLFDPTWKENGIKHIKEARSFLLTYTHSSFPDYISNTRPERNILALEHAPDFLKTQNDLEDMLYWQNIKESP